MTDFEKMVCDLIPKQFRSKIAFFNEWSDSDHYRIRGATTCNDGSLALDKTPFAKLSLKERMSLYPEKQDAPTDSNHWVWFGVYGIDGKPRYNGKPVARELFRLIQGGVIPSKRFVNSMASSPCDVNPFHLRYGMGPGTRLSRLMNPKPQIDPTKNAAQCEEWIVNGGYMDFAIKDIRQFGLHEGYSPSVIEQALQNLGLSES